MLSPRMISSAPLTLQPLTASLASEPLHDVEAQVYSLARMLVHRMHMSAPSVCAAEATLLSHSLGLLHPIPHGPRFRHSHTSSLGSKRLEACRLIARC